MAAPEPELVLSEHQALPSNDVPPTELTEFARRESGRQPARGLLGTRKRVVPAEPELADTETDAEVLFDPPTPPAPEPKAAPEAEPAARLGSLTREDPVVDAPSIGRKTAKQLARAGITTIGDLLDCDPEMVELELNVRHITAEAIRAWQDQTQLMIDVPGLRVHDAQLLVGAGITTREDLANASARTIFELAMEFLSTPEGERVLRDDQVLNEDEVEGWIELAQDAT